MKAYYLLFLTLFFVSCKNGVVDNNEPEISKSTLVELQYKTGTGNSSTEVNSLLGYGYDAKGFCDTVSARGKILDLSGLDNNILKGNPSTFYPFLISGGNLADFALKIKNEEFTNYSSIAFNAHIKALYKLAFNKDSMNPNDAYAYYAATCLYAHYNLYITSNEIKTTESFDNDLKLLSTSELISKYGTHVLTNIYIGSKIEALYRCIGDANAAEEGIYKRMKQFLGGTAGIIKNENPVSKATDEQLIYNSIGSKIKMCGLINATDNNLDNISKNLYSAFGDNAKSQFMQVGKDGLLPLYECIKDSNKKQEVKAYIEKYLSTTTN